MIVALPGLFSYLFWKEIWFEEFDDGRHGGHLGYRIGTILTIPNMHVALMPPTNYGLNPTYRA